MNSRLLKNETTEVLEEILACLVDSDRYIDEQRKLSIIDNIEIELSRRGLKQYETDRICKSRLFKCLGCGFKGSEEKADSHQIECDSAMELIS